MNLNKTMQHFGLAGTGVIVLLLTIIVYYLYLIEENTNTNLERFSIGVQRNYNSKTMSAEVVAQLQTEAPCRPEFPDGMTQEEMKSSHAACIRAYQEYINSLIPSKR